MPHLHCTLAFVWINHPLGLIQLQLCLCSHSPRYIWWRMWAWRWTETQITNAKLLVSSVSHFQEAALSQRAGYEKSGLALSLPSWLGKRNVPIILYKSPETKGMMIWRPRYTPERGYQQHVRPSSLNSGPMMRGSLCGLRLPISHASLTYGCSPGLRRRTKSLKEWLWIDCCEPCPGHWDARSVCVTPWTSPNRWRRSSWPRRPLPETPERERAWHPRGWWSSVRSKASGTP